MWYEKAAEQGDSYAMEHCGIIYHNGSGNTEANREKALYWYKKAAEQNSCYAQIMCAWIIAESDSWEAFEWYKKAVRNASSEEDIEILPRVYETIVLTAKLNMPPEEFKKFKKKVDAEKNFR